MHFCGDETLKKGSCIGKYYFTSQFNCLNIYMYRSFQTCDFLGTGLDPFYGDYLKSIENFPPINLLIYSLNPHDYRINVFYF